MIHSKIHCYRAAWNRRLKEFSLSQAPEEQSRILLYSYLGGNLVENNVVVGRQGQLRIGARMPAQNCPQRARKDLDRELMLTMALVVPIPPYAGFVG